jgi:valyl-tRNA synthetase
MFGETAVAVHPDDERYGHLVGQRVKLPLTDKTLPIIADTHADPDMGTGALKVSPGHDFDDFGIGERHDLEAPHVFDSSGVLNDLVPAAYQGLDRFAARKQVVADLTDQGFLVLTEDHVHKVPYGDRSGVVLEPRPTDQWFMDTKMVAQNALNHVESGKIDLHPSYWGATYRNWLENIEPWCISRQLWWGHQLPVWYGDDGTAFVAETHEGALAKARVYYGIETGDVALTRDEDVLDTWFSSALWPFVTLGWPHDTLEMKEFFPSTVLVTGSDILFFWVARMVMMSDVFCQDVPFKDVYLNALVRDKKGQKMSKSKGNVIDPLTMIDTYGADALRYSLSVCASPSRDLRFSEDQVVLYRNFMTKIWNAARLVGLNQPTFDPGFTGEGLKSSVNRWIMTRLCQTVESVAGFMDAYRIDEASMKWYHFIWSDFCDWYLESMKVLMQDEAFADETRNVMGYVFAAILHGVHPFAPFISTALWKDMGFETSYKAFNLIVNRIPIASVILSGIMVWLIKLLRGIPMILSLFRPLSKQYAVCGPI